MTDNVPIDVIRLESPSQRPISPSYSKTRQVHQDHEQTQTSTPENDVPPDGGYGYICVLASFLINAHTWEAKITFYRNENLANSSVGVSTAYSLLKKLTCYEPLTRFNDSVLWSFPVLLPFP